MNESDDILEMLKDLDSQFEDTISTYSDIDDWEMETDCQYFIRSSIHGLYSKDDNSYYYDEEYGTEQVCDEMKEQLILDLVNKTQNYTYFLAPIETLSLGLIADDDKTLIHLVKLTHYNPEVVCTFIHKQGKKRKSLFLELLPFYQGTSSIDIAPLYLKDINPYITEFMLQHKNNPLQIDTLKNILIEQIKQKQIVIFSEQEKKVHQSFPEHCFLEDELVEFYKQHFGIKGLEAFLENVGISQTDNLFEANLVSFKINPQAFNKTYLEAATFKKINQAIDIHHLVFPKSYLTYQADDCLMVSVEEIDRHAMDKIKALLKMISFIEPHIWQDNVYEQLMMMIEKINFDYSFSFNESNDSESKEQSEKNKKTKI